MFTSFKFFRLLIWIFVISSVLGAYLSFYSIAASPTKTEIFTKLANAYIQGHLYFSELPSPALLKLPDPYTPQILITHNLFGDMHDMSLFHGKFYTYYGPTNALFLIALKFIHLPFLTDATLTLIWTCGLALVLAAIFHFFSAPKNLAALIDKKQSAIPATSFSLMILGYLFTTLNFGLLGCLIRPLFYEAAVTCAAFFFWLGVLFLLYALAATSKGGNKKTHLLLFCSGLSFGLCFFARFAYGAGIFFTCGLFLIYLIWMYQKGLTLKNFWSSLFCFSLPLFITAIAFFIYNKLRFGSITDTGFAYVLASFPQHQIALTERLFNWQNLGSNLYMYLFAAPNIASFFPYATIAHVHLPSWTHTPWYYYSNGTVGLTSLFAITFLTIGIFLFFRKKSFNAFFYISIFFFTLFLMQWFPFLFLFNAEVRYFVDFSVALSLATVLLMHAIPSSQMRYIFNVGLIFTTMLNLLLTFGEFDFIKINNPSLYRPIQDFFDDIPAYFSHEKIIFAYKITAKSEKSFGYRASNLLDPSKHEAWETENAKASNIHFYFSDAYVLKKITLTARDRHDSNVFWQRYIFNGYLKGEKIFTITMHANQPAKNAEQTFYFSSHQPVDELEIMGQSPVLESRDGQKKLSLNEVHPGFNAVYFYADTSQKLNDT